jgi:predicted TIM-barrel fold metal-dependent hydrolase
VDAHVHLWDPARTDWYPYLSGRQELGMGDVTAMARRFDAGTHAAESEGWNVVALVNVAAATGRHSVEETLELDGLADETGQPAAIIGGLPTADGIPEVVALVDSQMRAARFRGVRPMGHRAPVVPDDDVLRALTERELIFELMARPPDLVDAARRLASHSGLTVVVEHTGWPRSADPEERRLWAEGIAALASAGEHVHCKLSGLAMPLGEISAPAFAPWLETAIDAFGVRRCLFASNFPVDGLHGTLGELWSCYSSVVAGLDAHDRELLFAGNAEVLYRM